MKYGDILWSMVINYEVWWYTLMYGDTLISFIALFFTIYHFIIFRFFFISIIVTSVLWLLSRLWNKVTEDILNDLCEECDIVIYYDDDDDDIRMEFIDASADAVEIVLKYINIDDYCGRKQQCLNWVMIWWYYYCVFILI
jgi:hypothetical protein